MASAMPAFFTVCGFDVGSAGIVKNGLTNGKYISHKYINTIGNSFHFLHIVTLNDPLYLRQEANAELSELFC